MARLTTLAGRHDAGFTFVELLGAMAITLVGAAAAGAMIQHAAHAAQAQPAAVDAQQRARVSTQTLLRDLAAAGGGLDAAVGTLGRVLPPILPRRIGLGGPDPAHVARADVFSVLAVPHAAPQAELDSSLGPGTAVATLASTPACANGRALCGLLASDTVVVFDGAGRFGLFEVTATGGSSGAFVPLDPAPLASFSSGDRLARLRLATYYFDAGRRQLRRYDGAHTDQPVIDDVVGLTVEYEGDPAPPAWPKPPGGVANCLYDATGVPVGGLVDLRGPGVGSVVSLPLAMFTDGPWCGAGHTGFDVDLMRIRRVTVAVRVQASSAGARGTGGLFARPGTATAALSLVPDVAIRFSVAPANLQVSR